MLFITYFHCLDFGIFWKKMEKIGIKSFCKFAI